ncbi:MAG TPA: VOC family protein [Acetobacteraceae bacterium]|nr:VOC family protein [Acetobacteraceae bacterium]
MSRILETSLYVADLDRAEAFYARMFGFTRLMRDQRMCAMAIPNRQVLLLFRHGGSLQPSRTPAGTIPPHDASGHQHLCFSIDMADLDAWRRHLGESGVAIESEVDWPARGTSLYFRDPDAHSLEVATAGLWANDPLEATG